MDCDSIVCKNLRENPDKRKSGYSHLTGQLFTDKQTIAVIKKERPALLAEVAEEWGRLYGTELP